MIVERTEAIEWLKSIKEKYIHGGDDFYDHQRRTAIDYAVMMLEQKLQTNADRIRAMSDEKLADVFGKLVHCGGCPMRDNCKVDNLPCNNVLLEWLKQPAEE